MFRAIAMPRPRDLATARNLDDSEVEPVDTANWFHARDPRIKIRVTVARAGLTERTRNSTKPTCAAPIAIIAAIATQTDTLIDAQSMGADAEKRRKLVWRLNAGWREDVAAEDAAPEGPRRTCCRHNPRGLVTMTNSRASNRSSRRLKISGSIGKLARGRERSNRVTQGWVASGVLHPRKTTESRCAQAAPALRRKGRHPLGLLA
jgi:hypothetical protein